MAFARETPLKKVLGLGSAHEGTGHFWRQRLTGLANLVLATCFVVLVVALVGRPYAQVVSILASPLVALVLLLMRPILLILNTFFAFGVAAISIFAILKLAFGGA
jgi:succinate dehydrogenase / fumarate reductase membrane anchor subunit